MVANFFFFSVYSIHTMNFFGTVGLLRFCNGRRKGDFSGTVGELSNYCYLYIIYIEAVILQGYSLLDLCISRSMPKAPTVVPQG